MDKNGYNRMKQKTIVLFDLDGTLTVPRNMIKDDMKHTLKKLRSVHEIGIVSGSDLSKLKEQIGNENNFDYILPENGIIGYKNGKQIFANSIQKQLGDETLQTFINYALGYMSKLILPFKRGTFIEFRQGLINIAPPGRNCSQAERDEFEKYDKIHQVRTKFVEDLRQRFSDLGLVFSIGGQISFDVFPKGWDKSFCLQHFDTYDHVYFFGDKTMEGGNDHEIFIHPRTKSFTVVGPEDTQKQIKEIFPVSP
ncbi:unnamed protein product [Gordionus sp. m RMFG-2023]|uniref:uncharacterized protein LOC135931456 isoform X2 n=1 Tax=Gordionus sp. m RMFG-2023 TaxID=3053472 RepID=UPI0030E1EDF6